MKYQKVLETITPIALGLFCLSVGLNSVAIWEGVVHNNASSIFQFEWQKGETNFPVNGDESISQSLIDECLLIVDRNYVEICNTDLYPTSKN